MKTAKKTLYPNLLPFLGLLVLLTLLLAACGNAAPTGSKATPTPTGGATPTPTSGVTPTPTGSRTTPAPTHQNLVYVYEDSAHTWHVRRYDTSTRQKTDIYTTEAGQIKEAQVSADGQWVLFLTKLYPAMSTNASAKVQLIRVDGQSLQTLYSVAKGKTVSALEWSPDQRYIAFQENLNVYLLNVASRTSRLVVPANGNQVFVPRTWLDNTRLYLSGLRLDTETPPLKLYLLDITSTKVQQVLNSPTLGGDFDSSIDGTTLFTSQYVFAMPTAEGPSSIEAQPAAGGHTTTIYSTPHYAITALRVASRTSLLFVIHNTGVSNVDTSHNGLWKINTDGTGLTRLTSEASDELTMFPTNTQYVWSSISRDGSLYAVTVAHPEGPNATFSLLIGPMGGGKPVVASTGNTSTFEIAGWTKM